MANRGYLCAAREPLLYPSVRDARYDPSTDTIAASVRVVPVLWLAGFVPSDVVRDEVRASNGNVVPVVGASAARERYLEELPRGAARLAVALGLDERALDEHARMLATAVGDRAHAYVSTELEEIWALRRQGLEGFAADLEAAIRGDALGISHVSGWKHGWTVPDARLFLRETPPEKSEVITLDCLLGHSHICDVPWEPSVPPPPVEPPLIAAIVARDQERALALITDGADPSQRASYGSSALTLAAALDERVANVLLDRGAPPDDGAFVEAVHKGRRALAERMLALGANPRASSSGDPVLTRACQAPEEAEALAELLLAHGADPNEGSMTPLMAALATKREGLVRLLLAHGARVDAIDSADRDVLWWARFSKRSELIALIEARMRE